MSEIQRRSRVAEEAAWRSQLNSNERLDGCFLCRYWAFDMALSAQVESYKFWDVVTLWARERLEHEEIVARALAKGVVCDGLVLNSVDPKWLETKRGSLEFHGYPYVGYRPVPDGKIMILRAEALEHLLSIVRKAKTPHRQALGEEFIAKIDFQRWLARSRQPLPEFWFGCRRRP